MHFSLLSCLLQKKNGARRMIKDDDFQVFLSFSFPYFSFSYSLAFYFSLTSLFIIFSLDCVKGEKLIFTISLFHFYTLLLPRFFIFSLSYYFTSSLFLLFHLRLLVSLFSNVLSFLPSNFVV
jgi:hypothetical protein